MCMSLNKAKTISTDNFPLQHLDIFIENKKGRPRI